jgi:hypothetical protein
MRNADVRRPRRTTRAQEEATEQQRKQSPEYAQQAQAAYQAEQQKYDDLKAQLVCKPQTELDKQRNAGVVAQLKEQYKTLKDAAAEALRTEQFLPRTPEAPSTETARSTACTNARRIQIDGAARPAQQTTRRSKDATERRRTAARHKRHSHAQYASQRATR